MLNLKMPYQPINSTTLPYFSRNWVPYMEFLDFLSVAAGEAFQTQSGRDTTRESLQGFLSKPVDIDVQFPDNAYGYVFLKHTQLTSLFSAVLAALDTRNRVIEVVDPSNPTTAESLNAVKRTDDASVAARTSIERLSEAIISGAGRFSRAKFESELGLVWTAPAAKT